MQVGIKKKSVVTTTHNSEEPTLYTFNQDAFTLSLMMLISNMPSAPCPGSSSDSEDIPALTQQLDEVVIDMAKADHDSNVVQEPESASLTQIKPRQYQLEMVEESLKRNIIVALG